MAEGLLRFLYGNRYEAYSAGTRPSHVDNYAIKVMHEIGIDITSQYSKSLDEFRGTKFDYVVTVCDHAKEACPFFPEAEKYLHRNFEVPNICKDTEEETLDGFRHLRDTLKAWLEKEF
jgi:arsenate reductase